MINYEFIKEKCQKGLPLSGVSGVFSFGLILLSFLFSVSSFSQVTSSVDTTTIRIGEEIKYTLQVQADSTDTVLFPEGQSFAPLEMIESYKTDTLITDDRYQLIKKYGLTQFDSGAYTIPEQRVVINGKSFKTDSVLVEVHDVAVDTTKQKMFDIKDRIDVDSPPFDFLTLLYWLLGILAVAGIVYYFFRRKKRKEEKEKLLPPYEEALVSLNELDNSSYLRENKSKAYYSHLTEIVKRYLDREVDETAQESTSDELIARLQMHKDAGHFKFDEEMIQQLDAVLKRADLVKFAKMHQLESQATADRKTVENVINQTHESLPEPTEEELQKNEEYLEQQRRKRKNRRIVIGIVAGVFILVLTTVILGATLGWSYLKDNIIGHPTKELVEGRWYKSEYGNPAVIIETPEILKRVDQNFTEEQKGQAKSVSSFAYGSLLDKFYVFVSTVELPQNGQLNADMLMEQSLQGMEAQGAKNLIVKKDEFDTDKGVKGLRAYGTFNEAKPNGEASNEKQSYQSILFTQPGSIQQIMVSANADDEYAQQIIERIIASIEVEVVQNQPQKPAQ